jgi:3-hydroxyisobutyrate dehydrogenase-like beta-hydroxyacid dehydrogenase
VIQTSTISPGLAVRPAGESRARGLEFLDCPVSGTAGAALPLTGVAERLYAAAAAAGHGAGDLAVVLTALGVRPHAP